VIHLHNGDSTVLTARRAGIPGRHVAFRETLVTGPVRAALDEVQWIEDRARFLAEQYGENLLRTRTDLLEQERMLDDALHEDETVLWFEYDLFCLINFLYLLNREAKARRLTIVWSPEPLGAMDEAELVHQFQSRAAPLPSMMRSAAAAWEAYTADDPTALNRWLAEPSDDFPFLRDGLRLHASRFPSMRDGLGEVERRAMTGIAAGAADFGSLFARFDDAPPRFGFGDTEFRRHLRLLATCAIPMITMAEKEILALTPAGQNVLDGKIDFIDLNNAAFWLGGAFLTRPRHWRWDGVRSVICDFLRPVDHPDEPNLPPGENHRSQT